MAYGVMERGIMVYGLIICLRSLFKYKLFAY